MAIEVKVEAGVTDRHVRSTDRGIDWFDRPTWWLLAVVGLLAAGQRKGQRSVRRLAGARPLR